MPIKLSRPASRNKASFAPQALTKSEDGPAPLGYAQLPTPLAGVCRDSAFQARGKSLAPGTRSSKSPDGKKARQQSRAFFARRLSLPADCIEF
jgi:hypothetical protein